MSNSNLHKIKTFDCIQKFAITPSLLHHQLTEVERIHQSFAPCLTRYYLKYWSASYLLSKLKAGTIIDSDLQYVVIYGEGCSRGKLLASPDSQVKVSFRAAQAIFDLSPYALVTFGEI